MRDRMYLDTMQQIYTNVTKVMVESRQGGSLLYLPLDKLLQQSGAMPGGSNDAAAPAGGGQAAIGTGASGAAAASDSRSRDASRTRERETR
jgi:membrane protease subunit HflK